MHRGYRHFVWGARPSRAITSKFEDSFRTQGTSKPVGTDPVGPFRDLTSSRSSSENEDDSMWNQRTPRPLRADPENSIWNPRALRSLNAGFGGPSRPQTSPELADSKTGDSLWIQRTPKPLNARQGGFLRAQKTQISLEDQAEDSPWTQKTLRSLGAKLRDPPSAYQSPRPLPAGPKDRSWGQVTPKLVSSTTEESIWTQRTRQPLTVKRGVDRGLLRPSGSAPSPQSNVAVFDAELSLSPDMSQDELFFTKQATSRTETPLIQESPLIPNEIAPEEPKEAPIAPFLPEEENPEQPRIFRPRDYLVLGNFSAGKHIIIQKKRLDSPWQYSSSVTHRAGWGRVPVHQRNVEVSPKVLSDCLIYEPDMPINLPIGGRSLRISSGDLLGQASVVTSKGQAFLFVTPQTARLRIFAFIFQSSEIFGGRTIVLPRSLGFDLIGLNSIIILANIADLKASRARQTAPLVLRFERESTPYQPNNFGLPQVRNKKKMDRMILLWRAGKSLGEFAGEWGNLDSAQLTFGVFLSRVFDHRRTDNQ